MLLGIKLQHFLLFSVSWINTESTPIFTEFNRNQSLLEFPLNCIRRFLSSEVKCVMTALEENKGIAIFNNQSLACQTCNEDINGHRWTLMDPTYHRLEMLLGLHFLFGHMHFYCLKRGDNNQIYKDLLTCRNCASLDAPLEPAR